MTANEKKLFEAVPANEFNTYWVPCTWFVFRLQEAAKQGKLINQYALENIMRVRVTSQINGQQEYLKISFLFLISGILRVPSQMWIIVVL